MVQPADRRVAKVVVTLAAVCFATLAMTVRPPTGLQERSTGSSNSDVNVLRTLVQYATKSDRRDAQVQYELQRTVPSGRKLTVGFTSWYRYRPYLSARVDGVSFVADNARLHVECRIDVANKQCFQSPHDAGTSDSATLYFAAVRVTKNYRAEPRPSRTIAGEAGHCFRLVRLANTSVIAALGDALEVCFANDGIVLRTELQTEASHDIQTASGVRRGFDAAGYAQLLTKFGADTIGRS